MNRWKTFAAACVVASLSLVAAGCGDDNTTPPAASTGAPTIAVPDAIKAKGTLVVAADASYPPNEFFDTDGKTVIGADPDLMKAIGDLLGLKVDVQNAGFDGIIPGLASGKYDIGASSFTDTKEREKVVDFVTYLSVGTSFYVKTDGGPTINTLDDLCGQSVAVERATTQADASNAQDKKCKDAGKPGVTVSAFADQNAANLAVQSGRAKVGMADLPPVLDLVKKSNGLFKTTGAPFGTAPYGIAIPKGNGMAQPIQEALKALMANGKYMEILNKWGLQDGAITDPKINGALS